MMIVPGPSASTGKDVEFVANPMAQTIAASTLRNLATDSSNSCRSGDFPKSRIGAPMETPYFDSELSAADWHGPSGCENPR